ncbi:WhiB family transcriptional regulator [Streptomyces sp. NPDC057596]|uniref:WhiB family transcriptional regulator n=1 Tax=Streptomyces sp. NPDC057596 TaxID=3346178 RepID=UPI00369777C3
MTTLTQISTSIPGVACRTASDDLWFSDYRLDRVHAAGLCHGCPLAIPCRTYAYDTRQAWGVWGGHDFTVGETHCGTERGHQIHARNGETPCEPCRAAHAELVDGRRRARLAEEHAKGGTVRGYGIHLSLGEQACVRCRAARARESAECRARRREAEEPVQALPIAS